MSPPAKEKSPARDGNLGTGQEQRLVVSAHRTTTPIRGASQDVFAEINVRTIPELAAMLGLPELKPHGTQRSPFRDERHPSFSVFDDGHGWKDHGSGEGGDCVEFVRVALGCDHAGVRDWYLERHGIDRLDGMLAPQRPAKAPEQRKPIEWPGELVEGTAATWAAFAERRGIAYKTALVMAKAGILRFVRVNGVPCYCITDSTRRAAEIRRLDGRTFGEKKAFALTGVRKDWLPGMAMLKAAPPTAGILITEGATDLITAYELYTRYRSNGGPLSWVPCALLGSKCWKLAPEAVPFVRGRRVRIVPDNDGKSEEMAPKWKELLLALGCTVDVVKLPWGRDLSDVKEEIQPEDLYR